MKFLALLLCWFFVARASAQLSLPVIRANSKSVSIRDGAFFDKDTWSLNPALRPDTYSADRMREAKYVTFYTDVDSIRVRVTPGSRFDFVIVYQGKDSCFTRIESSISPVLAAGGGASPAKPDTIPFKLTAYSAIAVRAIIDGHDTVSMHFDLSAFGLHLTKDAILHRTALLPNREEVLAGSAKPNYRKLNEVSTLRMGTLTWHDPVIAATDVTAHEMDGRIGWDVFEGKVVELNYERGIMVIHPRMPRGVKGYKRSKLDFIRSFPCAAGTFLIGGKEYSGDFLLDTGSDQGLLVDSSWAVQNHFPADLPVTGTQVVRDPRGRNFTMRKVTIPAVRLNGFVATQVPAMLMGAQQPVGFPVNCFGNGLLRRYDLIVDFQKDELYLRPNANS
ncbi:MAG TPA: hypothetical protein VHE34_08645 [Puia sp.]|uniref:hypothetical protein n=1 Tax=Puia sp. TaxID=2045100 RepID=UPI002CD2E562|nr:hypothetical protein [Puia sp.]HVU95278.1 hypothetical protein [Puia sp.]